MSTRRHQPPVVVIFGITGDLSKRKLLPALYHLFKENVLPAGTKIIGTSRHRLTPKELLGKVELCVLEKDKVCDPVGLKKVGEALETIQVDPEQMVDFTKLKQLLDKLDTSGQRSRLLYMSIPSSAYPPIIKHLATSGLNHQPSRILLEKPFGYDLASAKATIKLVHEAFKEEQIYRIDHYLAKETAINLLEFRMHNPIFTPLWNSRYIHSVRVRQFETIGIEGRVNFYEQTGALRDIVQSHLMQLLALTLMELPKDISSQAIHQAKQEFFTGLKLTAVKDAVRAQYDSYREEVHNPDSHVETYIKLKLRHDSPTWQDAELILEHGKAMDRTTADVIVEFKTPHERNHNNLVFQIQPNEGISLDLVVKRPGFSNKLQHTLLDFRYHRAFKDQPPVDAYERVLMDAIRGDQSLFASDQEVLMTWQVLQPLIDAWANDSSDLKTYTAGSQPKQS